MTTLLYVYVQAQKGVCMGEHIWHETLQKQLNIMTKVSKQRNK